MRITTVITVFATVFGASALGYCQGTPQDTASNQVTREAKSEALKQFIKDFKKDYVFPELAEKVSAMLQKHLDQNDYDSIQTGPEFAKTVANQIHELCPDAHLRFRYTSKILPIRKADNVPTAEEIKARQHVVNTLNGGYERVERLNGNIGYLEVRGFPDANLAKGLSEASMNFLANTDALILDLRRNGGGDPEAVRILLSYFFDKRTHLNDLYFREGNQTTEFWTSPKVKGAKYLNKDIYVLTSERTGSGAEECAYDLQCLHRATIIGSRTWGGANPGGDYRLSDHFAAFIPDGRAINPYTKTNWEGIGVIPDVKVAPADALREAQKLALQKLITTASATDKERYEQAISELSKNSN